MKTKVSVVLPTRNEEELIGVCLNDLSRYLNKKNYKSEIIVVTNGCTDATLSIVKRKAMSNSLIKIINSKPGYGIALRKGLNSATGEYVVIFNVDFYDLHLIDLIDIDLCGKDLVIGSKMAHWAEDKRPVSRKLFSVIYNLVLKILFNFKGSDTHGIKVLKKGLISRILRKCKINSGIMDTEFVIRAQRSDFKIADFPVMVEEKRKPRFSGRFFSTPVDFFNLYQSLK